MFMTEYEPNMRRAQKRVKLFIPVRSNAIKSTRPKDAQKSDCDVSKRLNKILVFYFKQLFFLLT